MNKGRRKTYEEFIAEAKEVHGDHYDYSKVEYINNKTKVKIRCNRCGKFFEMIPTNHINKRQGCPNCYGTHSKTNEEFINEARKVHGDKYDYSLVEYKSANENVTIICPIHGEFNQVARKHLMGHGCRKCSNREIISFDEFVKRAKEIHGENYEYHKDKYTTFSNPTFITCSIHGDFEQIPQVHISGCGCPKCGRERTANSQKMPFLSFVEKARLTHGDTYEYHEEDYSSYAKPTRITCKTHGDFFQIPSKHVDRRHGCPQCARERQSERQRMGMDEFLSRARKAHGDKYDYTKVNYASSDDKVVIICPKHGEFEQKPSKHWIGHGCPKCGQSHLEREVEKMLGDFGSDFKFIYQATKKDLDFLGMKSLDFYIPSKRLAIECQGIQHFEDVKMLKSEEVQLRDKIKFNECIDNEIDLIYFVDENRDVSQYDFYKDKKVFNNILDLKKFVNETAD